MADIKLCGDRNPRNRGMTCSKAPEHAAAGTDHQMGDGGTWPVDRPVPTYGRCTGCGSVEVALVQVTGTTDLSHIGESSEYPTGYGCEVCA